MMSPPAEEDSALVAVLRKDRKATAEFVARHSDLPEAIGIQQWD
jgi:hypothetical protein